MSRPARLPIDSGLQGWDAQVDDNFETILDDPFPVPQVANDAALPTASLFDRCLVTTIDNGYLYLSDGSVWQRVPQNVPDRADTSGLTLGQLETELNNLKQDLRDAGLYT